MRIEKIGDATLVHGDCLEYLSDAPCLDARAMICDPPYCSGGFTEAQKRGAKGQGLRSETLREKSWFGGDNMTTGGLQWLLRMVALRFKQHAYDQSCTASLFCDWRMVSMLAQAIESAGLRFQSMPIWDKENPGLGTGFRAQHECILHFSIDTPTYFSFDFGNVLRAPRMPSDRDHPTEKPVSIMAALVKVQSDRGQTVLDPFMGSGSTGVAAVQLGRKFVGIEVDPKHFDTACRRIEAAAKSVDLFEGPPPKPVQESIFGGEAV